MARKLHLYPEEQTNSNLPYYNWHIIDTLREAKKLEEVGFSPEQAAAIVENSVALASVDIAEPGREWV